MIDHHTLTPCIMEKIPLNLSSINYKNFFLTAVLHYIRDNFPEIHSMAFLNLISLILKKMYTLVKGLPS